MKNQLVIHPQAKLKVVHRNFDTHNHAHIGLTSGLQEVCRDLRDIASLIENQIDLPAGHSSSKDTLKTNIKD